MLFDQGPSSSFLGNMAQIPTTLAVVAEQPHYLILPILGFLILFGWQKLAAIKNLKIPAQLMAVLGISGIAYFFPYEVKMVQVADNVFSKIGDGLLINNFPGLSLSVVVDGIILGLVASAESMLSTGAVKKMAPKAEVNFSKELFAQGVGNTLAGLLGALPITGVIVRTTANVEAGGKSRWSAIMHGLWLLLFVALGSSLLRHIPLSVLAVILVIIGYKLMKPKELYQAIRNFNYDNFTLLATWAGIIFVDLLSGVCIGIGLATLQADSVKKYLSEKTNLF
jgi:MFS superfamily sulfate permease-like transporter